MSEIKNARPVTARDTDRCNKAVVIPGELYSNDGRKFLLTKWAPVVSSDGVVTATIETIVCVPVCGEQEKP